MPFFSPQIINEVRTACGAGVQEAAAALSRAFDGPAELSLGAQGTLRSPPSPLELDGPGLIVAMKTDRANAALIIPAGTGLMPPWCAKPDAGGEGRLATLAQELQMNLLPEAWLAHDLQAKWVSDLGEALERGGAPPEAIVICFDATRAGLPLGTLSLIWPINAPDKLFLAGPVAAVAAPGLIGKSHVKPRPALALNSSDLPPYTRSLLRIKVPVVVALAEKRQKLSRIIELGPGSIIQFDKSCQEMLDLEVGNRPVACGEAVKVGDKFGLRITSISLPEERFDAVKPRQASEASRER